MIATMVMRRRLRRAAARLAAHGWPVTPGAYLRAGRFHCGRPGCPTATCHPALEGWEEAASCDLTRVGEWWRYAPYGVLLPTGLAFEALEVAAPLGALVTGSPRWRGQARGPVATSPTGRWMFLVRPGDPLLPELAGHWQVVWHARGSWMPAPPTPMVEGPVRWSVPPAETGWRLPASLRVQELLAGVLPAAGERDRPARHRLIWATAATRIGI